MENRKSMYAMPKRKMFRSKKRPPANWMSKMLDHGVAIQYGYEHEDVEHALASITPQAADTVHDTWLSMYRSKTRRLVLAGGDAVITKSRPDYKCRDFAVKFCGSKVGAQILSAKGLFTILLLEIFDTGFRMEYPNGVVIE
jgi:hypothetical protein